MSSMEPMRHLCDGSLGCRWEIRNQMLETSNVIQRFWKVGNMRICCFLWLIVSWYIRWALVLSGVRMWWPHGCPPPFQLPLIYWFTTRSWRICQVWYCFSWISISVDCIPHIARVISTTHLLLSQSSGSSQLCYAMPSPCQAAQSSYSTDDTDWVSSNKRLEVGTWKWVLYHSPTAFIASTFFLSGNTVKDRSKVVINYISTAMELLYPLLILHGNRQYTTSNSLPLEHE